VGSHQWEKGVEVRTMKCKWRQKGQEVAQKCKWNCCL